MRPLRGLFALHIKARFNTIKKKSKAQRTRSSGTGALLQIPQVQRIGSSQTASLLQNRTQPAIVF
jgi:hypothetical protein